MRRPVAQFALAGLVLAVCGAAAVLVLRSLAHDEALRDARQFATLAGQGIVEPTVQPASSTAILRRSTRSTASSTSACSASASSAPVWDATGRIVYSDEPRLIGSRFALDADKRDAVPAPPARSGRPRRPENRFERGHGISTRSISRSARPTARRSSSRRTSAAMPASTGRRIWLPFAGLLVAALVLLWLLQVPLAWRLGHRLRRTQEDRERCSPRGRGIGRRAAHRGGPPRRAGAGARRDLVFAERGGGRADGSEATRATLLDAATTTRGAMQLRSLLVEIHPPNLRATGLEAALADLLAQLTADGVETTPSSSRTSSPRMTSARHRAAAGRSAAPSATRARRMSTWRWRRARRRAPVGARRRGRLRGAAAGEGAKRDTSASRCSRSSRRKRTRRWYAPRPAPGRPSSSRCDAHDPTPDRRRPRRRPHRAPAPRGDVRRRRARRRGIRRRGRAAVRPPRPGRGADGHRDARAGRHRATRRIVDAQPAVAIVVLTSFSDRAQILRALDAGAVGYLLKDAEPEARRRSRRGEGRRRSIPAPAGRSLRAHGDVTPATRSPSASWKCSASSRVGSPTSSLPATSRSARRR